MKIIAIGALVLALVGAVAVVSSNRLELASEDPHAHDHAHEATVFVSSGGNEQVAVVFANDHIDMTGLGYEGLMMQQVAAASGVRYENREANLVLLNKGDTVTIYRDDQVLFEGTHLEHGAHEGEHGYDEAATSGTSSEEHTHHDDSADASTTAMLIQSKTWVWEKYLATDGTIAAPRQAEAFTLSFGSQSQISGTTDCNNFGGSYTLSGSELEFGPFMSTKMYCEGSQETEFLGYLGAGHLEIVVSGNELILKQEKGGGELHFVAK